MNITIGSEVISSEGERVGKVGRVVFDPTTDDVDQIVVEWRGTERLVPLNMIENAGTDSVRLRVTAEVVEQLPHFDPASFEAAPETCPAVATYGREKAYPPSTFLFPGGQAAAAPPAEETHKTEALAISEGTEVQALDGKIGVVDEVLTDQYQDKVTGFIVRKGTLLSRDVRVPIEWVDRIGSGCINLSVTKRQLEERLEPPEGPYIPVEGSGDQGRQQP